MADRAADRGDNSDGGSDAVADRLAGDAAEVQQGGPHHNSVLRVEKVAGGGSSHGDHYFRVGFAWAADAAAHGIPPGAAHDVHVALRPLRRLGCGGSGACGTNVILSRGVPGAVFSFGSTLTAPE